jgi:hypothetical protein
MTQADKFKLFSNTELTSQKVSALHKMWLHLYEGVILTNSCVCQLI